MKNQNKMKGFQVYESETPAYVPRQETLDGVDYLVVPVVMMVEGVRSGSHGPILHTAEELGKVPESWNGIPITLGHPQVDSNYVSANSPQVLQDWSFGRVFNAHMDGDALKAEAWIQVDKLEQLDASTLERINAGEVIEVSVGVFSDEESVPGTFRGEKYVAVSYNYRPDHLAILPSEIGACSVAAGCGLRVNKKGESNMELIVNETNQKQILKELSLSGFSVNETGFRELSSKIQDTLNNKDNGSAYHYIEEVFGDYVIYRATIYNGNERSVKYFKQSFEENAAGDVQFTGEAVQVKRVVDYPVVTTPNVNAQVKRVRTKFNNNEKEENTMSEKCAPCVKAAVDNLIVNKATAWSESDRDFLESLSEEQLEKFNVPALVQTNQTAKVTKEDVLQVMKGFSLEEHLSAMPSEMSEQVRAGIAVNKQRKDNMVSAIITNTENVWTKEELEALPTPTLEKLYLTANKKVEKVDEEEAVMFGFDIQANAATDEDDILMPMN